VIDTQTTTEVLPPNTGRELVPTANLDMIDQLAPGAREIAVTGLLDRARTWLATAVQATEPRPASEFKAWITTIHEVTKQLGLSKAIQWDAQELVRRAERGVGKAIREGQENGSVVKVGAIGGGGWHGDAAATSRKSSYVLLDRPTDFVPKGELSNNGAGIYTMTDGVTDEQFEEAVTEAKAEENLSRANVVRKVKSKPKPEAKRHELLRNTHHHKPARIVEQTAITLDGLAMGLALVTPGSVPEESKTKHTQVMKDAIGKIRTFIRTEMSQA